MLSIRASASGGVTLVGSTFGDGTPITPDLLLELQEVVEATFAWLEVILNGDRVQALELLQSDPELEFRNQTRAELHLHEVPYYHALERLFAGSQPNWWKDPSLWPAPCLEASDLTPSQRQTLVHTVALRRRQDRP